MFALRAKRPIVDGLVHHKTLHRAKALCGVVPTVSVDLNGFDTITCPSCLGMLAEIRGI